MKIMRMMKKMMVVVKVDWRMRGRAWTMKKGLRWTRMEREFPYTAISQGFSWVISKVRE